jgi:tetratricopeptide (TPR) repeat protein
LLENAYSIVLNLAGKIEASMRHALAGQQLLSQIPDEELRALAPMTVVYPLMCAGQFVRARELLGEMLDSTRGHPEWGLDLWQISAWAWGHFMEGAIELFVGNLGRAKAQLERGIELARQHGDPESEGWAFSWFGEMAGIAGDAEIGLGASRRCLEISERMGSPYSRAHAYYRVGICLVVARRWPEAIETLERALTIIRERRTGLEREAGLLAWLAEACLGSGDLARSRAFAEEAVAIGRRIGVPVDTVYALKTLAHVLLAQEGAAAATAIRGALTEAEQVIAETGATSLAPLVLLERAELARLEGDDASRERALREAHGLFTEMGATARAEQVARQLGHRRDTDESGSRISSTSRT